MLYQLIYKILLFNKKKRREFFLFIVSPVSFGGPLACLSNLTFLFASLSPHLLILYFFNLHLCLLHWKTLLESSLWILLLEYISENVVNKQLIFSPKYNPAKSPDKWFGNRNIAVSPPSLFSFLFRSNFQHEIFCFWGNNLHDSQW